jgi:hypothetical protein
LRRSASIEAVRRRPAAVRLLASGRLLASAVFMSLSTGVEVEVKAEVEVEMAGQAISGTFTRKAAE